MPLKVKENVIYTDEQCEVNVSFDQGKKLEIS